jgi:5-methylcytosine-specific restriction endonuclease McrA
MTSFFQRIDPTPIYEKGVTLASFSQYNWGSQAVIVTQFKTTLKKTLRKSQMAQCCFCRRQFGDDYAVHIEHFVDKSLYGTFTFEIRNLALACGTCNGAKNGFTLRTLSRLKKRAIREGKVFQHRCLALSTALPPGTAYPLTQDKFRWVHPHIDQFSQHIELGPGWTYTRKTLKGYRTIRSAGLNDIARLEQRATQERLNARGDDAMSSLLAQFPDLPETDIREVAADIVRRLHERRNATKSP